MNKNYIIAGALVITIGFSSCSSKKESKAAVKSVRVETVASTASQSVMQYPGKVKASDDANLSFKVAGRIQKFLVNEGTYVHQGQVLVEMDPADYKLQLKAIEAEYTQIKNDCERIIALYADSATTKSNYDKAVSGLEQITAKLENARNQVSYTKIIAPYDGYVQKHIMAENEIVSAGLPVISMMSSKAMEVEINLPISEYVKRQNFKSYTCSFDVFPGKVYELQLINITPKANSNQLYPMRFSIRHVDGQQMPSVGMNTTVSITSTEQETEELIVPTSAVRYYEGKSFVYVVDKGVASERVVNISSLKSNGTSIITSSEVKEGDVIISSGIHHIDNGDAVKPLAAPSAANVGKLL